MKNVRFKLLAPNSKYSKYSNYFKYSTLWIKYFYGDYEEDSLSNGDITKYHYINAPNGLTAVYVIQGSADTLYHILTDHLGSIAGVINSTSDEVKKYSYNAWGIPGNYDDWTEKYVGELFTDRGYTGHQHLQEFDLINMNGRVYDAVLGRFLSPDPFVQFPGMADGLNRYSYVMNNPLKFTDPTGFMSDPSGSSFSTYGDWMWNSNNKTGTTSGGFYYRGWYYAKNPQGFTILGSSFSHLPIGFVAGGTFQSKNAHHGWEYDYANETYRNTLTGELYNPHSSIDFNSFWSNLSYTTWKFKGSYFLYEDAKGNQRLYLDGTLNEIEGTFSNNPSAAGSNSLIAANGGGDETVEENFYQGISPTNRDALIAGAIVAGTVGAASGADVPIITVGAYTAGVLINFTLTYDANRKFLQDSNKSNTDVFRIILRNGQFVVGLIPMFTIPAAISGAVDESGGYDILWNWLEEKIH